jgi:FkbM family methyltransferase
MQAIDLFTGAYAFARSHGLLDTRIGSSLFISTYFQYKKHLEDSFAGLINKHPDLFRGGHILDVGANIGYCSALFSRAADAGASVFAFEPEPFNVSLLQRVIRDRKLDNVIPVQAAVGAADGEIQLQLNPRHHGDHRVIAENGGKTTSSITVPLVAIDSFLAEKNARTPVCFIKIDVQGFEQAVCDGAAQTLEENPSCCVVLEYMPSAMEALGFHPPDLLSWFERRGYVAHVVQKDGAIVPGTPSDTGERGYVDVLFSPKRR